MKAKKKKKSWWYWILWIIIILLILNYIGNRNEKWKYENCNLSFSKYTYESDCAGPCSSKCSNEGFSYLSSSWFEPYLSVEEMNNPDLYKQCECNCGGCRGR